MEKSVKQMLSLRAKRSNLKIIDCFVATLLAMTLSSCASVTIPNYIKDVKPYEKKFYADFDVTKEAVTKTLANMGWEIAETAQPVVFEESKKIDNPDAKQILLFTSVKRSSFIIGTKYQRLNIYLQSVGSTSTDVDLRYMKVTSYPLKSFTRYKNDALVERIFKNIESNL